MKVICRIKTKCRKITCKHRTLHEFNTDCIEECGKYGHQGICDPLTSKAVENRIRVMRIKKNCK